MQIDVYNSGYNARMGQEPFFTYEKKVFLFLTVGAILAARALIVQAKKDKRRRRK